MYSSPRQRIRWGGYINLHRICFPSNSYFPSCFLQLKTFQLSRSATVEYYSSSFSSFRTLLERLDTGRTVQVEFRGELGCTKRKRYFSNRLSNEITFTLSYKQLCLSYKTRLVGLHHIAAQFGYFTSSPFETLRQ
jgi:hypothetical protein